MTTIAADCRGGQCKLASDSRTTYGGQWFPCTKVVKIEDYMIAFAGSSGDIEQVTQWLRDGRAGKKPKNLECDALIVRNGCLFLLDGNLIETLIERGFHALGSGGDAALGAMMAGASVERAVEIACLVDAYSALPLQCLTQDHPDA